MISLRSLIMWEIVVSLILVAFPSISSAQEIFDAIRADDLGRVRILVESDPTVIDRRGIYGDTPLHIAAQVDNAGIAGFLIDHGADLEAQNGSLYTPLLRAGLKVTRVLVEHGADIDFISGNSRTTALYTALLWKDREVGEYLLESGASLPGKDSPLFWIYLISAMKKGIDQYLERSLETGWDHLYSGESGNNLFHYASESNNTDLLDKLLALGLPLDRKNIYGWTPLHNAAFRGNLDSARWFMDNGADPDARTIDGNSVFSLAVLGGSADVARYLRDSGVDQNPSRFPDLSGDYLGQAAPGIDPVPFAPGIIAATHRFHSTIAFSKSGDEAYWGCPDFLSTNRKNGLWTRPDTTSLIEKGDAPFFSPDGDRFYYVAQVGDRMWRKEAIYFMEKLPSGWSRPRPLPEIINATAGIHFAMSVDLKGNIYFGARQDGTVVSKIYLSELDDGIYSEPVIMDHLRDLDASSPYISPDGNYLIVASRDPAGLLISFRNDDGSWSRGNILTESGLYPDRCPMVSHDGNYLFYLHFIDDRYIPYWVDSKVIEDARP